ncbi:hypothetical protein [Klebsiella phage YC1]|nr:hypothetical protein [Klebsiella phage YC1]
MNDIKRVADLMHQSVIQHNSNILKTGLIVLATDQNAMVKSSIHFIPTQITAGKNEVEIEVEAAAKEFDFRVHYLDKVMVVLDDNLRVRAVIITGGPNGFPDFQQLYPNYFAPPIPQAPSTNIVEVVGFSDAGMYPESIFSFYEALCKIYNGKVISPADLSPGIVSEGRVFPQPATSVPYDIMEFRK